MSSSKKLGFFGTMRKIVAEAKSFDDLAITTDNLQEKGETNLRYEYLGGIMNVLKKEFLKRELSFTDDPQKYNYHLDKLERKPLNPFKSKFNIIIDEWEKDALQGWITRGEKAIKMCLSKKSASDWGEEGERRQTLLRAVAIFHASDADMEHVNNNLQRQIEADDNSMWLPKDALCNLQRLEGINSIALPSH